MGTSIISRSLGASRKGGWLLMSSVYRASSRNWEAEVGGEGREACSETSEAGDPGLLSWIVQSRNPPFFLLRASDLLLVIRSICSGVRPGWLGGLD